MIVASVTAGLSDILTRRQPSGGSGYCHRLVELVGGQLVLMSHYEPDPATSRSSYYYNTTVNRLYRRIVTDHRPQLGVIRAQWKRVSQ